MTECFIDRPSDVSAGPASRAGRAGTMPGTGKLAAGIILIIIAIVFLIFGGIAAATYSGYEEAQENNRRVRDTMIALGQDASEINETIAKNDEMAQTKVQAITGCIPTGIVLAVLGAYLILRWSRQRMQAGPAGASVPVYSAQEQVQIQPPFTAQDASPAYNDQNLYSGDYQQRQQQGPPQYPGYQPPPPPPRYPGDQNPPQ